MINLKYIKTFLIDSKRIKFIYISELFICTNILKIKSVLLRSKQTIDQNKYKYNPKFKLLLRHSPFETI